MEIENYIRRLGLPATVIRPVTFMETYYIDQVEIGILKGRLADPIRGDKPYQTIATADIGAFVALAFERPRSSWQRVGDCRKRADQCGSCEGFQPRFGQACKVPETSSSPGSGPAG